MNSDTKTVNLPSPAADFLNQSNLNIDNVFSTTWKSFGFKTILRQAKFRKRSGTPVEDVVYLLMLWVWLKVENINGENHLLCARELYKQHVKGKW